MEIYCPSLTTYQRLNTRCVSVGDVGVGGKNPIRIQSMTTPIQWIQKIQFLNKLD